MTNEPEVNWRKADRDLRAIRAAIWKFNEEYGDTMPMLRMQLSAIGALLSNYIDAVTDAPADAQVTSRG
jgi:hypothetical protein